MFNSTDISGQRPDPNITSYANSNLIQSDTYRTILDNLPVGIMQISEDEKVLFANTCFIDMLGYTRENFPATIKDLIKPEIYFHSQHTWKDMWHNHQFQVGIRFHHQNGLYIPTENIIRLVLDQKGHPAYALFVSRQANPKGKPIPEYHISMFDPLTSLPGRNYLDCFLDGAIERTRQSGKMLAILHLNINRFRIINESLGHDAGDALLKLIAKRLIHAVHEKDTVIRLSGDEFVIVLEKIDNTLDILSIATRLLKTVTEPLQLSGHDLSIAVSIGGSLFPQDSSHGSILLKYADVAMSEAKKMRSSTIRFFNTDMNITPTNRLISEFELRQALDKNEFVLYYQPRLSLSTGKIVGLEALIRWNHPVEGIVTAGNFIPMAEEIGLIEKIGHFVLDTITLQLIKWRNDKTISIIPIAFNVSTRELYTSALKDSLLKIIKETGLNPNLFELEITESSLIENMDKVRAILTDIHQMGIPISIDDFGTGYSSLRYLSALPVDLLKIDSSFISGLAKSDGMRSIIKSTIVMAHSLGMQVIAEGVSTQEQQTFLLKQKCDQIQGYLCSPPLPPDELIVFLRNHKPSGLHFNPGQY